MASSSQPPTSVSTNKSTRRRHVTRARVQPAATTIFHTVLLQICFQICTTVLSLTSPTHAYPLRALDDSGDNNNTIVTEATNDVSSASVEEKYGKLILDVGQKTVISTSNWILGTLLIIVGLVQVFYGFKFIRMTLVLTGFISWAVVAIMVTVILDWELVYFLFKPSHYTFWIWFLAGCLGAIVCFRYWDLGVAFSGGFGGFALAMGIIAAVNDSHNITNTARFILLAILILIGAAIATFYERFSIILGTSLGGAFLFMFGVDEFVQVGYREMIVIFDFAGKTLQYHPDRQVYIMIGCSLALACLGIAWEFWHHAKPLMMDRKALFRIYGRPFGKRPQKLAGQRLKKKVAQSDWYTYLTGCLCLRKRTAEEVLYDEYDEGYDGASAHTTAHAHNTTAVGAAGDAGAAGAGSATSTAVPGQSGVEDEKAGSTSSENAMETVVIVVEETSEEYPTDSKPIAILPGTEVTYVSGIESSTHHVSQTSSSSSSSTLTAQAADGSGPVEVVITETSESVDENGAKIVTTTTTTTSTTLNGEERHEQHYSSQESRIHHSESSTSFHQQQSMSTSNSNSSSSQAEVLMRTESSSTSSTSESTHRSTAATRSMEINNTSTSRTLLQSMAAAHHSASKTTTTTTTTNGSGSTTVVTSQSSSSSS